MLYRLDEGFIQQDAEQHRGGYSSPYHYQSMESAFFNKTKILLGKSEEDFFPYFSISDFCDGLNCCNIVIPKDLRNKI